ncbi:hypothetical protein ACP4OV_008864 [Aristida adscensionis]
MSMMLGPLGLAAQSAAGSGRRLTSGAVGYLTYKVGMVETGKESTVKTCCVVVPSLVDNLQLPTAEWRFKYTILCCYSSTAKNRVKLWKLLS